MTNDRPFDIIEILKNILKERENEVNAWFAGVSASTPPFFYNSVDLRYSGFKLAPVDTNLFPAGFNNLNQNEVKSAVNLAKEFFEKYHSDVKKVLILAEDHTRNKFYLDNIFAIKNIIEQAGKEVVISNLHLSEIKEEANFESHSKGEIHFKPAILDGNLIKTIDGFTPDLIVVNNDLTSGIPEILENIKQPISPPAALGWHMRRKTEHFAAYNNLIRNFCYQFDIDPWLLSTYFEQCGVINFKERKGIECVALRVDKTISYIKSKYEQYGIEEEPYVFIKSDRGTYGMGIMTARSGDEVFDMSKNIRKKMNTIKGGTQNTEVIIQEGVPTVNRVNENPAEPMIYMVGGQAVGCIYRLNTKKDPYGNLNSTGMEFVSIVDHSSDNAPCQAFSLVAKLASYAAAWECYVESYNI